MSGLQPSALTAQRAYRPVPPPATLGGSTIVRQPSAPIPPGTASDAFTRADSTTSMGTADSGQAWTYPSGTWGIISNAAYAPGASGSAGASVDIGMDPSTGADYVEVGVTLTETAGFSGRYPLVFLGAAAGATHTSAFRLYVDGTSARVVLQNGTGTSASASGLSLVSGTRLSLRAYAASGGNMLLSARIDGVEVTTLSAPSRTGTYAGIGTGSAGDTDIRFDDFSVVSSGVGGTAPSAGTATGSTLWAGTAAGSTSKDGTSSGSNVWAGTATGSTTTSGAATGATAWTGTATGSTSKAGTGTGATSWVGAATGATALAGTATGATSWTGTAAGTTTRAGTSTGSASWVGTAAGSAPAVGGNSGTATGATTWSGTATGTRTASGTATGSTSWLGVGLGQADKAGVSSGATDWQGVATGTAPTIAIPVGTAAGATVWLGSAVGISSAPVDVTVLSVTELARTVTTRDVSRGVVLLEQGRTVTVTEAARGVTTIERHRTVTIKEKPQ